MRRVSPATHPKSGICGSKGIRLLRFLCLSLETSQYPSGFCLEEVTLFVRLDGEHPSSSHLFSRLNLPHIDEIKNLVVNPGSVFKMFWFRKLFAVTFNFLGCLLPFVHEISSWPLFRGCLSAGGHTAFQHVSGSTGQLHLGLQLCARVVGHFIEEH